MKIRRTAIRDVCYIEADSSTVADFGIVEWRINARDHKFLMTPIFGDGHKGQVVDATEAYENFLREKRREK